HPAFHECFGDDVVRIEDRLAASPVQSLQGLEQVEDAPFGIVDLQGTIEIDPLTVRGPQTITDDLQVHGCWGIRAVEGWINCNIGPYKRDREQCRIAIRKNLNPVPQLALAG